MITGDAKETAVAIAKQLEIISSDQDISKSCFTGNEFDKMNAAKKRQILKGKSGKVFSRVEPKHKREIVKLLDEMVSPMKLPFLNVSFFIRVKS